MRRPGFHTADPGYYLSQQVRLGFHMAGSDWVFIRRARLSCPARALVGIFIRRDISQWPSFLLAESGQALSRRTPVALSYCGPRPGPQSAVPSQAFIGHRPRRALSRSAPFGLHTSGSGRTLRRRILAEVSVGGPWLGFYTTLPSFHKAIPSRNFICGAPVGLSYNELLPDFHTADPT